MGCDNKADVDNQARIDSVETMCHPIPQNTMEIINIKNELINKLDRIKIKLLEEDDLVNKKEKVGLLKQKINNSSSANLDLIPKEIVNYIFYIDENIDDFRVLFNYHEPLKFNDIALEYMIDYGFFSLKKDIIDQRMSFRVDMGQNSEISFNNPYQFFPIAGMEREHVLVNISSLNYGQIVVSDEIQGYLFAPNLIAHIDDLISGLKENYYLIDKDGNIIFPNTWESRRLVKTKEYNYLPCTGLIKKE